MTKPAAIQAGYADWKLIKTRGVIQLCFEVPIENADAAYQVLGGMPNPGSEVWCAIARLNPEKENAKPRPSVPTDSPETGGANRRPFTSLPLPQQAALLCNDPIFHVFVSEEWDLECRTEAFAALIMYDRYKITSRSEIKLGSSAAERFIQDREQFMAWKMVAA